MPLVLDAPETDASAATHLVFDPTRVGWIDSLGRPILRLSPRAYSYRWSEEKPPVAS